MGLSRVVSEIDDGFSRKSQSFPTTLIFSAVANGVGTGAVGQNTRMMGLPGRQRGLTITSDMWIIMIFYYTNCIIMAYVELHMIGLETV